MIMFLPQLMLSQLPTGEPTGEPTSMDAAAFFRIPFDVDMSLHGLPGPFLLLDFLLCEKKYSVKTLNIYAPMLAAAIGITYAIWVEYCASLNGSCTSSLFTAQRIFTLPRPVPYPFLTWSPFPQRVVIYAVCTSFSVLTFRLVNWLHN